MTVPDQQATAWFVMLIAGLLYMQYGAWIAHEHIVTFSGLVIDLIGYIGLQTTIKKMREP